MWVTKHLISPVKIRIFCPKTTNIGPEIGIFVHFGPGLVGSFGALLVDCLVVVARGCISQDTYLLYLIHTIYRPLQIFQRYVFTKSRGQEHMVRDMAWPDQWSSSPGENNKNGNSLSETIYSGRELLNSVLPAMPQATGYQRPRVTNLLQSSPSSQPRESYKVKMVSL